MQDLIYKIIIGIFILCGFYAMFTFGQLHTGEEFEKRVSEYENCVYTEYKISPQAYYKVNGEMPYCEYE